MTQRILVPFDGSPLAERALEYALEAFPEGSITALYVINPIDSIVDVEAGGLPIADEWYENAQERADTIHATANELAATHDTELESITEVGRPTREILQYADEHDVDQIVMGSHGRQGIERVFLGSVAETVMRRARIPVTIVR